MMLCSMSGLVLSLRRMVLWAFLLGSITTDTNAKLLPPARSLLYPLYSKDAISFFLGPADSESLHLSERSRSLSAAVDEVSRGLSFWRLAIIVNFLLLAMTKGLDISKILTGECCLDGF